MSDSVSTTQRVRVAYQGAEPRRTGDGARPWSFVLVRLTGLALSVLVLGHFALTHIVNDVAETDSAFVARRWDSALWVTWDWLMLVCAVAHGAAGVWVAIDDYTPEIAGRRRRHRVLLGLSAVALALGTITIVAATR
jgi:succinate dehydrogenase / fumarate reductase membrane anchor subunit